MYNMQPYSLLECRVYHACVLTAPHFRPGKSIHFLLSHSKINNLNSVNCSVVFFLGCMYMYIVPRAVLIHVYTCI